MNKFGKIYNHNHCGIDILPLGFSLMQKSTRVTINLTRGIITIIDTIY